MVDKAYCMSSYLAFRYIVDDEKDFAEGLRHRIASVPLGCAKRIVESVEDIDCAVGCCLESVKNKKLGIMLSGGMDSAILASYMKGYDAYTFRFLGGEFQKAELERAKMYAERYGLKLHFVDIDWKTVEKYLDPVMKEKGAPVHSIEPQLLQAAMQAKEDGIEMMIIGNAADYVFGGMDQLLSKDWEYDEFIKRYVYIDPKSVLKEWSDIRHIFEKYREGNLIDFIGCMNEFSIIESYGSYENAFLTAQLPYLDPYSNFQMKEGLDLQRVRNGESKYLIRELFALKYPNMMIPDKVPMPRPVDLYFKDWKGPERPEFIPNLCMNQYTGNQKWLLYCLERFLNMNNI